MYMFFIGLPIILLTYLILYTSAYKDAIRKIKNMEDEQDVNYTNTYLIAAIIITILMCVILCLICCN